MSSYKYLKTNLYNFSCDIFPYHRSLASKGTLETLKYLKKSNSSLKLVKTKSRKKVFDWIIPDEWNVKKAYIIDLKTGKKVLDYKNNNLHIVQYSVAINKKLSFDQLKKKLFFDKSKPNAIPFVTSYYKRDWGFCLKYNEYKKLKKISYFKVVIDSSHKKGHMYSGEAFFKGKSKKEILFSSYICHPSMANNEVSGIVVLNALIKYIQTKKNRYYSYRFSLAPETIGSINFIKKNLKTLKKNLVAGFNISCVGDENHFSMVTSKQENSLADKALYHAIYKKKKFKMYSFLERGSDERQYCSPLLNLPYCNFSRSLYGKYNQYHSSMDNLQFISQKGLETSLETLTSIIDIFENGIYPKSKFICEPFLSKYNLYPTNVFKKNSSETNKMLRDFIAYSDGKTSIFDICNKINASLDQVREIVKLCKEKKIIDYK
tara:strand:+ start:50703 stop:51998 length:1296 start_codon:yes stop_codon:yes gene_type:complete